MEKVLDELKKINGRLDRVDNRLDNIDGRMDGMESRLNGMGERMDSMESRMEGMESKVDDMQLRFDARFEALTAGQANIRSDIKALRHDLFIEEGSRAHADDTLFQAHHDDYKQLEQRVRVLEAKFPDLARQAA